MESGGGTAIHAAPTSVEDADDLEHVVTRIKAQGEGAFPAGVAAFVAHEHPMSAADFEEHERMR